MEKSSWHYDYRDTSWISIRRLPKEMSEGDVLAMFSQFGEVEDVHLVRDKETGVSKGVAFLKYEEWESTVLAVDNFNGTEILDNKLRVDHFRYEAPKKKKEEQEKLSFEQRLEAQQPGQIYRNKKLEGEFDFDRGVDLFAREKELAEMAPSISHHKRKKKKKKRKKEQEQEKAIEEEESGQMKRARLAKLSQIPASTSWKG